MNVFTQLCAIVHTQTPMVLSAEQKHPISRQTEVCQDLPVQGNANMSQVNLKVCDFDSFKRNDILEAGALLQYIASFAT